MHATGKMDKREHSVDFLSPKFGPDIQVNELDGSSNMVIADEDVEINKREHNFEGGSPFRISFLNAVAEEDCQTNRTYLHEGGESSSEQDEDSE